MRNLSNRRIYELPTSERLVVLKVMDSYWLFEARFGFMLSPKYSTDPAGHIINQLTDQPTAWTVDDLVDTGVDLSE